MSALVVPWGALLPEHVLSTEAFAVLATFVALNTVMYLGLALSRCLPKTTLARLIPRTHSRAQTRSIWPGGGG